MEHSGGGVGSKKHGKSGKPHTSAHFTGKKRGKRITRKNPKNKHKKKGKG